jgi:hypothetical protein
MASAQSSNGMACPLPAHTGATLTGRSYHALPGTSASRRHVRHRHWQKPLPRRRHGQRRPRDRADEIQAGRAAALLLQRSGGDGRHGSGPGSQWLARKLAALGHAPRILPAQFVKPYVKSNKNDSIDAEAIAEAATRPHMRFVAIKRCDQVDVQALHRARDALVYIRTALISQMRAFLIEYGMAFRPGPGAFRLT